jgi:hypothetical protein
VRRASLLLALVAALSPLAASAQNQPAPPMPDDPRAPRFHEVERGAFVGFEAGWLHLLKTPTADPARFPFAGSGGGSANLLLVGARAGYDVTERLAISLFALTANGSASPSYGAFSVFAAGGDVRFAVAAWSDAQGVHRWYAFLHARAGWVALRPVGLLGNTDALFAGGPGVEYFTRLRHFSISVALDGEYLSKAKAAAFAPLASVRYTF